MVDKIRAYQVVVVFYEVQMFVLNPVINYTNTDAFARVACRPGWQDVEIASRTRVLCGNKIKNTRNTRIKR